MLPRVSVLAGFRYFNPGNTTISGDICYVFSRSNNSMKVQVDLANPRGTCTISGKSESITPCNRAQVCPSAPSSASDRSSDRSSDSPFHPGL